MLTLPMRSLRVLACTAVVLVTAALVSAPGSNAGPATPNPQPTCGGGPLAKSTASYWQCTFTDEFDGSVLDTTKWAAQQTAISGFRSGPACFKSSTANVSVANGLLNLTARQEATPFVCRSPEGDFASQYTSGSVSTFGTFSQAYGRFEVRARLPAATVRGLQEAIWLWPVNSTKYGPYWPMSGEIDIAEVYSVLPDRAIPYIHYVPARVDYSVTNNYCMIADISQLHTYVVEWTPAAITVIYDGHTCLVDNWYPAWPQVRPQPFDQPFMIALTQALGVGYNAFDPAATPLPATTQVDYVHVWK